MSAADIEREILLRLYRAYYSPEYHCCLYDIREDKGWDEKLFENLIYELGNKYLIKSVSTRTHILTEEGVIHTEEKRIVPDKEIDSNSQARTLILDLLGNFYEQEGHQYHINRQEIALQTDLPEIVVNNNLRLLEALSYVESYSTQYKVTQLGLESVRDYRERKEIGEEFDRISKLKPQQRGRELQKVIGKIIEQNGWQQEESVKTSNEEMDNIAFKGREFYLIECKWEKNPIQANVVRELFGKLGNRIDVRGIVASMSGFTSGAIETAENYIGQKVILLFGSESNESMIFGKNTFEELLDEKYKELIMRRKVLPE